MAHILVLEDEFAHAQQYKTDLEANGHTVEVFAQVDPALVYIERQDVDLIIADIFIAKADRFERKGGITLISQIKQMDRRDVPVIAVSGGFAYSNPDPHLTPVQLTAKTVGADITLPKPVSSEALLSSVSELLEKRAREDGA